jgi:hypothetical protein
MTTTYRDCIPAGTTLGAEYARVKVPDPESTQCIVLWGDAQIRLFERIDPGCVEACEDGSVTWWIRPELEDFAKTLERVFRVYTREVLLDAMRLFEVVTCWGERGAYGDVFDARDANLISDVSPRMFETAFQQYVQCHCALALSAIEKIARCFPRGRSLVDRPRRTGQRCRRR